MRCRRWSTAFSTQFPAYSPECLDLILAKVGRGLAAF